MEFRYRTQQLARDGYKLSTQDTFNGTSASFTPPAAEPKNATSDVRLLLGVFSFYLLEDLDGYLMVGGVDPNFEDDFYRDGIKHNSEEFDGDTGIAGGIGFKGRFFTLPLGSGALEEVDFHFNASYIQYHAELYPYATENGVRRSFSQWNTFPSYTSAKEDYVVDSYEGNLQFFASTPLGPLTPYAGLGGTYQYLEITGELKGYRTANSSLVFSYKDRYQFTNPFPFTFIAGTDWDIVKNLRFNLEGQALGEWTLHSGLSYLFP